VEKMQHGGVEDFGSSLREFRLFDFRYSEIVGACSKALSADLAHLEIYD
jgi:hypothetical protein